MPISFMTRSFKSNRGAHNVAEVGGICQSLRGVGFTVSDRDELRQSAARLTFVFYIQPLD